MRRMHPIAFCFYAWPCLAVLILIVLPALLMVLQGGHP